MPGALSVRAEGSTDRERLAAPWRSRTFTVTGSVSTEKGVPASVLPVTCTWNVVSLLMTQLRAITTGAAPLGSDSGSFSRTPSALSVSVMPEKDTLPPLVSVRVSVTESP